jgi:hypothetical protein
MMNGVIGSANGWMFILAWWGLPTAMGVVAVIVSIRAGTRADHEPRTAADNDQRRAAAIGTGCGTVSFVVSATLLICSLLVWLALILLRSG